jgi:hypothetical protein
MSKLLLLLSPLLLLLVGKADGQVNVSKFVVFGEDNFNYTADKDFVVDNVTVEQKEIYFDEYPFCDWINISFLKTLRLCETWQIAILVGLVGLAGLFFYFGRTVFMFDEMLKPVMLLAYGMGSIILWLIPYSLFLITSVSTSVSQTMFFVWTNVTYVGLFAIFLVFTFFIINSIKLIQSARFQKGE